MGAPLVFVFTCALAQDGLEGYERYLPELYALVGAQEPRLLAMETYLDADKMEVSSVLVQPDSDAQEHHMRVAGDKLGEGYQFMDFSTMRIDVFGSPGEVALGVMRKLEASGVTLNIKDRHLGGVNRLADGPRVPEPVAASD